MPCALPPVDQASSQLGWGYGNFSGSGSAMALHRGLDFMADEGSPVLVPYAGTVVAVGRQNYGETIRPGADGLGHYVVIAHGLVDVRQPPVATRYAHLREPSALRVGQRVNAGDLVGYIGRSGRAPGSRPILFFQTIWDRGSDGDYVNAVPRNPFDSFFTPLGVTREGAQSPGPPVTPYTSTPTWGGRLMQDSSCESAPALASVADPRRQQPLYARFGSTQLSSRAVYRPALYDAGATPESSSGALILGLAALAGGVWWLTRPTAKKGPPWWVRQQRWRRKP